VPNGEQIADILTKPLVKGKLVYFRDKLGVVQNTFFANRGVNFVAAEGVLATA
jgi:hypothetical protein